MHQEHHHHHEATVTGPPEDMAICPIMHVAVNKKEAEDNALVRSYNGTTYYMCCNTCVEMFDQDPEKYTHSSH